MEIEIERVRGGYIVYRQDDQLDLSLEVMYSQIRSCMAKVSHLFLVLVYKSEPICTDIRVADPTLESKIGQNGINVPVCMHIIL